MNKIPVIFLFFLFVFLAGCTQPNSAQNTANQSPAVEKCVALCNISLENGNDLSAGPCLSNQIIDDWVCDVVHNPRAAVDDQTENQCPEFGKTAKHFVEVSPACELIRQS